MLHHRQYCYRHLLLNSYHYNYFRLQIPLSGQRLLLVVLCDSKDVANAGLGLILFKPLFPIDATSQAPLIAR